MKKMTKIKDAALAWAQNHENKPTAYDGFVAGAEWLDAQFALPMTTTELWNALETVLRAKGATKAWLDYALPDLHTAAMQYASGEFTRGYVAHENGEGCGAYDPPRVGGEPSLQERADHDQAEYEDMREAFQAGYKYGNELDRGADLADLCFAEWMGTQLTTPLSDLDDEINDALSGFGPAEGMLGGNS